RDRGVDLDLRRQRVAFLVEVDDRRAARLALVVLDRIATAPEEFAEPPPPLDHLPAADRALVLAHLADRRLALLVDGLGVAALEEKAVLADAVQQLAAALFADVRRACAAGVLDLLQRAVYDLVKRPVEVAEQLNPVSVLLFDLVKLQLHAGREPHVEDVGERL